MTNVFATPRKVETRNELFQIAVEALEREGWKVERVPKVGKASVRRITKGETTLLASIRTSQDTYIAFQRNPEDTGWTTLDDVDRVVAVSVDDQHDPQFALVHVLDADDMRHRFDRTYEARRKAGHVLPAGRGVWLPLYVPDSDKQPGHVGGGAGLVNPPIARVRLKAEPPASAVAKTAAPNAPAETAGARSTEETPLTIPEAKRRLALTLGVKPDNIRIMVEG